ncbi:hypothetical protein PILCRDRAFT_358334 [Piloderma croceum F 1598]|uniref:NUDE domain-containing protein n=1 Tax=Piloderma croceum (strain F 1598) TaxID=765440 RepID=A0A0C3G008_PILCF|nr:hypothetical protein PILCRDRAFT_358334 [Piloderma croceum F 1598]
MTAVLQATDALRRERSMASDDSQINYSSGTSDWKAKYNEVADMLAETRAELDEFHSSSKELEEELIKEIDRTEKAQQDLKVKVARSEAERDEWKSKFMTLQTNHNTTTTSLQRELDTLRQDYQKVKVQLRELEMGNDDLERNERAVSSSLADIEAKYSRALEEKILLEHELLDKANLEEESQRLKDELRDANVEISILKDQVSAGQRSRSSTIISEPTSSAPSSLFPHVSPPSTASDENLLTTPPPPNLQLSDLLPAFDEIPPTTPTITPRPQSASIGTASGQSLLLQRAGFQPAKTAIPASSSSSSMPRSATLPSLSTPSRIPPRIPAGRTAIPRNLSTSTTSSTSGMPGNVSKSKGVQMVTEMRARVKILEQKIHTRVPRLRMGSLSGHPNANTLAASTLGSDADPITSTPATIMRSSSLRSKGGDDRSLKSSLARKRADVEVKPKKTPGADTSGWVLIMEDSPSPVKDAEKERRRASSPSAPTAFRLAASTSAAPPTVQNDRGSSLFKSTMNAAIRRPQSRLSATSASTTATTSSIPTPSSRPATPTFLPIPSSSLYAHSSTAGVSGLKRPTGPSTGAFSQQKRTSLGGTATTPSPPSDSESGIRERPFSYSSRLDRTNNLKALPKLPSLQSNITMRPPSKLSASSSTAMSKSRIGRPGVGRRSSGGVSPLLDMDLSENSTDGTNRPRAGSATATYATNGC